MRKKCPKKLDIYWTKQHLATENMLRENTVENETNYELSICDRYK